eukprot:7880046-Lingulodinium_polyedra.AAC.1
MHSTRRPLCSNAAFLDAGLNIHAFMTAAAAKGDSFALPAQGFVHAGRALALARRSSAQQGSHA